jgi:hypothetical protein
VVDADPARRLSFRVTALGIPVSEWVYAIEETDSGCRVTESWTDIRPGFMHLVSLIVTGVRDRVDHTQKGIEYTLERLGAAAEVAVGSS